MICDIFIISSNYFLISIITSMLVHVQCRTMLLNFQIVGDFPSYLFVIDFYLNSTVAREHTYNFLNFSLCDVLRLAL